MPVVVSVVVMWMMVMSVMMVAVVWIMMMPIVVETIMRSHSCGHASNE